MTVYVDDMRLRADVPNGSRIISGRWSHLMADTDEELHEFARRLGLSRAWAQYEGTPKAHYDVTDKVRRKALNLGAVAISTREGVDLMLAKAKGVPWAPERTHSLLD